MPAVILLNKSFGAKTLIYPTPVWCVGSFDFSGDPNVMTIAWGGICCSHFVGEILDAKIDEAFLGDDGKPDIEKIRPIIFSPDEQHST